MNSVTLIGRLGRDPELRNTGGGKSVVNFAIAVDYGYGDSKITSWIPIVAWEKTAELAKKFLAKGSQVAVTGRLQQRSYQDRDGNKHSVLEVVASVLDFIGGKNERQNSNADFDSPAAAAEEDPPF